MQRECRRGGAAQRRARQPQPARAEDLGQLRGPDRGVGGQVERATGVGEQRATVGVADVEGVDCLEAQPVYVGDERDQGRPQQRARTNGPAKSRRISVAASALKMSPGRMRTTRSVGCSRSRRSSCRSTATLWRE